MKKILFALAAVAMMLAGCTKGFDERLSKLEERVDALEEFVTNLNKSVEGVRVIVDRLEQNVYVTGVETTDEGYKLTFNQGNPIEIKHGKTGAQGLTGADGLTPTIDVYTDGKWYWKLTGKDGKGDKWMLDSEGKMVPALNKLEFSVDEGVLYVSIEGSPVVPIGSVRGDSWFEDVRVEGDKVVIDVKGTDNDLVLPFNAAAADGFALELQIPQTPAVLGGKITIGYTIKGCPANQAALFVYQLPEGWNAVVDSAKSTIELTTTENAGKVVIFAINNETGETKAKFIDYDPENLLFLDVNQTTFDFPAIGGSVKFPVSTGLDFKVIAPEWITPKKTTKATMAYYEYELVAATNEGDALREGVVKFVNADDAEDVYFTFTVSQKNLNKAILGEYLESYKQYSQPYNGTLKIEISDDASKGTYKVTICGTTLYADYEDGKLNCYDGKYTRTLTVASDYSRFEIENLSLGYNTYADYVAIKPLGAPVLTEAEQALVGVYNETWSHSKGQPAENGMEISASEDASYGQLKVKLLVTNDGSAYVGYASLANGKLSVAVGGQNHAKFGTMWDPSAVIELTVNTDGTLTMASWQDSNWATLTNYVATKYVEQGSGSEEESGALAGTWTVAYESTDNLYSDNGTWTSKTGTMTIEGTAGAYKITNFLGKSVSWALTESGNTLSYSASGLELSFTYDETSGELRTATGKTITDYMSFRIRSIVATKEAAEGGEGDGTEAVSFAGTWNVSCEMGDVYGMQAPAPTTGTMVITGSGNNYVIEKIAGAAYGVSVTWDGTALSGGKNGATLTLVYDSDNDTLTFTGEYKDYEHNFIKNIVATR